MSDYNVERAIELYFESGGIDLGPPSTNPPPSVPGNRTPSQHEIIEVDDLPDVEEEQRATAPTIEDDEAFARRLMQEDVDLSAPATNPPTTMVYDLPFGREMISLFIRMKIMTDRILHILLYHVAVEVCFG